MDSAILKKIFIGFLLSPELEMHLQDHPSFEKDLVTKECALEKVRNLEKNYIGQFVEETSPSIEEIARIEKEIKTTIKQYLPNLDIEKSKTIVFSQLFLGSCV